MADRSSDDDLIYGTLIASKGALLPLDFRKKHGSSEMLFVSAMGLQMVREVLATAGVLQFGTEALAREGALTDLLLSGAPGLPPSLRANLASRLERAQAHGKRAAKVVDRDFAPLNALVLVNLCAAFEVSTEDVILAALRFRPGTVADLHKQGVPNLGVPSGRDLSYAEAVRALRKLKRWAREDLPAPDGTLKMLAAVGFDLSISKDHRQALREMIYLRNCVLHRNQRADERAHVDAPDLKLEEGKQFIISRGLMGRYATATIAIASEIARAGGAAPKPRGSMATARE